ncbi:MAG: hypothetical protein Q8N47_15130 [Bryobacterales bacterium]|nr:hypothetical protein [Bryobacterales bacterium]
MLCCLPLLGLTFQAALAAPLPSERLETWKREIEQRGEQLIVARIETDRETNQVRIPPDTPRRALLAQLLASPGLAGQFVQTHAMTLNQQATEGRVHFVLLNMARAGEFKDAEEPLLAHEFGHAWLDALGFRSPDAAGEAQPCLAIQAGDIVQHILIRGEVARRGFAFRDYWIRNLDQALDALKKEDAPDGAGASGCDSLARIALWTDVRLALSADSWSRYGEFDQAFRSRFPLLAETVDELVTVLKAVDVTALERFRRALAYVLRRLAAAPGMEERPAAPEAPDIPLKTKACLMPSGWLC